MINIGKQRRRKERGPIFALLLLILALCFFPKGEKRGISPPSDGPKEETETPETSPFSVIRFYDAAEKQLLSMDMEEYLVGVLAAEMPASFEPEALKAQAVAARTYAVRRLSDPCGREGADLCSLSSCCQAYKGEAALKERWGKDFGFYRNRVREAVEATKGEILLYADQPIEALYHAASGGMTEDSQHVFAAAAPYLVGVSSENEAPYPGEKRFSREDFAKKGNAACPEAALLPEKLEEQVKILSRYESGRVERIRLGRAEQSGRQFRSLFGLNSANFTLRFTEDAVEIHTLGYGHGVGMSQYGAQALALEGKSYREILAHYYQGTEIKKAG